MSSEPYASQCTRVFTRAGFKAHLLPELNSPNSNDAALCGLEPGWDDLWHGTGSQVEIEKAASLPTCRFCEHKAAVIDQRR